MAFNVPAPFARHEAEVEAGDAGGGGVQHAEPVPADVRLHRAHGHRRLGGERQDGGAVGPRQRRLADDDQRPLGAFDFLEEGMRAAGELGEGLRAGAEMLIRIGEVGLRPDQADGKMPLRLPPALQDAGIEHRRFEARIGADEQNCVGMVDALDRRVEQIGGAAERGIELGAVLPAIDIGRAELLGEKLQREHLLGRGEIAGDGSEALAVEPAQPLGDGAEGFVPGDSLEPSIAPEVRPVEPLHAQAIPHMPRLVGDPFLVDGVVDARQDAHHLAPTAVDADICALAHP